MIERHERQGEGSIVTKSEINTLLHCSQDKSFFSDTDYLLVYLGRFTLIVGGFFLWVWWGISC